MANITRFDPFSSSFEDLFKGTLLRPMRRAFDVAEVEIKMNVTRTDGAYQVEAEMPGVKKEDIHVSVDGSVVTITGEVKSEKEEKKGDQVLRAERYFGKVERTFSLPQNVDEAHVEAKYSNGILKLTLPLREKSKAKAIEVA
jgi:HSP20 family protein